MWDRVIQEHYEGMKTTENEMIVVHQEELEKFEDEINEIAIPKPKFTKEVLNLQNIISKMIKAKRYREAEALIKKVKALVNLFNVCI